MKKIIAFLLTTLLLAQTHAPAEDTVELDGVSLTTQRPKEQEDKLYRIQTRFDAIGRAKVSDCFGCKHFQFYQYEIDGSLPFYACPGYKEELALTLGYTKTFFDWQHNPFFHQKHFNIFSAKIGGSTARLDRWYWVGEVVANFDLDHLSDLNHYTNFDFLLWGRYTYCPNVGVHIGFLGYTGMKINRVYPIIGFDYRYNAKWKFNAIFPVNISVAYNFNQNWSTYLGTRVIDVRYRVNAHSLLSKGLWHYRTAGGEIGLNYDYNSLFTFNAHVGTTIGGKIKIANRHNHHSRRYSVGSSGYAGAECDFKF